MTTLMLMLTMMINLKNSGADSTDVCTHKSSLAAVCVQLGRAEGFGRTTPSSREGRSPQVLHVRKVFWTRQRRRTNLGSSEEAS